MSSKVVNQIKYHKYIFTNILDFIFLDIKYEINLSN